MSKQSACICLCNGSHTQRSLRGCLSVMMSLGSPQNGFFWPRILKMINATQQTAIGKESIMASLEFRIHWTLLCAPVSCQDCVYNYPWLLRETCLSCSAINMLLSNLCFLVVGFCTFGIVSYRQPILKWELFAWNCFLPCSAQQGCNVAHHFGVGMILQWSMFLKQRNEIGMEWWQSL